MSITAIKTEIISLISTIPNVGQIATYPGADLDAEATGVFTGFFTSVTRNGVNQARRTAGGSGAGRMDRTHAIDVDIYLPMDVSTDAGAEANETAFDARVDAVLQLLADNPTLGGLLGKSDPPRALEDASGIRYYRGAIQCRFTRIRWDVTENARYDGRG